MRGGAKICAAGDQKGLRRHSRVHNETAARRAPRGRRRRQRPPRVKDAAPRAASADRSRHQLSTLPT